MPLTSTGSLREKLRGGGVRRPACGGGVLRPVFGTLPFIAFIALLLNIAGGGPRSIDVRRFFGGGMPTGSLALL